MISNEEWHNGDLIFCVHKSILLKDFTVFRTTHRRKGCSPWSMPVWKLAVLAYRHAIVDICMQGSGGTGDSTHHLRQQQHLSKERKGWSKMSQSAVVSARLGMRTLHYRYRDSKGEQLRQRRNSTSDRQKLEASTLDIVENRISNSQLLVKIFEAHSKLLSELALESVHANFRLPLSDEI